MLECIKHSPSKTIVLCLESLSLHIHVELRSYAMQKTYLCNSNPAPCLLLSSNSHWFSFPSVLLHGIKLHKVKLCRYFHMSSRLRTSTELALQMASDWKVLLVSCCHSVALVRVTLTLRCGHFLLQQPLILHVDVFTASCVLCQCCWDPERSQPHHCLYRWQNVFLEPGHALHPTGASLLSSTLQPAASQTSLHRNMSPNVPKACF